MVFQPSLTWASTSSLAMRLGAFSESYVNSGNNYFRQDAAAQLPGLMIGIKGQNTDRHWTQVIDVDDRYSAPEDNHYLRPHELYVGHNSGNNQWSLGRKRYEWLRADEVNHLGLFAPRYMDDKLEARMSSMTGLMFVSRSRPVEFAILMSPGFIPELGPRVRVDRGMLVSENPWFDQPTPAVSLFDGGNATSVSYGITTPKVNKIVFQYSVASSVTLRDDERFVRVGFADKPMNQLLLSTPVTYRTLPTETRLDIDIHARSIRHQLYALETGYDQDGGWHSYASVIREIPGQDPVPQDWISQTSRPAWISVASVGYDLKKSGSQATYAALSYIQVNGGDSQDRGEFAASESFFERRYQFTRAVKAELKAPVYHKGHVLVRASTSSLMDMDQRGMIWSSGLEYLERELTAYVRLDLLGILDNGKAAVPDGFIRNFRSNDRIAVGMGYVF